jgi:hypothetical protein
MIYALLIGIAIGLVFGMVIQWIADLPRDYRR